MYQYFVSNPVIAVIFIVLVIAVTLFFVVKKLQSMGLEKIRATVYKAFVKAENDFKYGANAQKFEYVADLAKSYLPAPFSFLITEKLLRRTVQLWFNLVKDLLDDGRINDTIKEE